MKSNRLTAAGGLLAALAGLALVAGACFGGGDEGEEGPSGQPEATATPAGPATAEGALRLLVEGLLNRRLSGECAQARRPDDVGSVCYSLREQRADMQAYDLGPTFSEPTMLVIVRREETGWTIVRGENVDPLNPIAGIPWPIQLGDRLVVTGTGDCLRARQEPNLQGEVQACLPDGTEVFIQEGPREADGYIWWRLAGWGWSADQWLRYPEEGATPEAATPTPTAHG